MRILSLTLLMGFTACADSAFKAANIETPESDDGVGVTDTAGSDEDLVTRLDSFLVDVSPALDATNSDGSMSIALEPQTFGPFLGPGQYDLELAEPIQVTGHVSANRVTPWYGPTLPTENVDVRATVVFSQNSKLQTYNTATDDNGYFGVSLIPDADYGFAIVPNDPEIPPHIQQLDLFEPATMDVELGVGVPIYGFVTRDDGVGMPGVSVYAINELGLRTAAAVTDSDGWYLIRVPEGAWQVVATGRSSGRDPAITSAVNDVAEPGDQVDIVYTDLDLHSVTGRVADSDGVGLNNVLIRFTSTSLDNYETGSAGLSVEVESNAGGTVETNLIDGTYTVEWIPTAEMDASPYSLAGVRIDGDTNLGEVLLAEFVAEGGRVVDELGEAVEDVIVWCKEDGFGGRFWSTSADASGFFALPLPQTDVICLLSPPATRSDLAMARVDLNVADVDRERTPFELRTGELVRGTITINIGDEVVGVSYAAIDIVDAEGLVWGSGLTTDGGTYEIRVDVTE